MSAAAAARPDLWTPHVHADPTGRRWSRLPGPDDVDVWVLTWLPGQATTLHDHGDSAAAFTVVQGCVEEVRPDDGGHLVAHLLRAGDAHVVAPGQIHDVRGAGTGPAVTVHAYSPRLSRMTFWEVGAQGLERGRTVHTSEPELVL